jgi:hypothetical protein
MSNSNCNTGQDLKSLRGKMPTEPIVVKDICVKVGCDVFTCVTKTTTFTAKGKLSYTSETVYTDKDGVPITGEVVETNCPMKVEIVTPPVEPPEPITLEGGDCAGDPVEVTGNPGELMHVIQAPGTVFYTKPCPSDADFELACGKDPATGHQVQTAYKIVNGEFVLIKRWDTTTGAEWTGDPTTLEDCGGTKLESDGRDVCVNGENLTQWIVKKDGIPTGTVYYTSVTGQLVDVAPDAEVTIGVCQIATVCEPTISSAPGDTLTGLLPGHSVAIQKASCCAIKVTTSAGSFIVRKGMTAYSTADFACPVTVAAVEILEGKCTAADVIVTTQKLR